jgi:hypothetical protein
LLSCAIISGKGSLGPSHFAPPILLRMPLISRLARVALHSIYPFIDEAKISSQLDHPAIAKLFEFGVVKGFAAGAGSPSRWRSRSTLCSRC